MKRLLGGLLVAVGILVAGLSGLCSLFFVSSSGGGGGGMLVLVAVIGGLPMLAGVGMIFGGRILLRQDAQASLSAFGESRVVHDGPVRPARPIAPQDPIAPQQDGPHE